MIVSDEALDQLTEMIGYMDAVRLHKLCWRLLDMAEVAEGDPGFRLYDLMGSLADRLTEIGDHKNASELRFQRNLIPA